jgi:hypothetical protein
LSVGENYSCALSEIPRGGGGGGQKEKILFILLFKKKHKTNIFEKFFELVV